MINVFKLLSELVVILLGENTESAGNLPGILAVLQFIGASSGI